LTFIRDSENSYNIENGHEFSSPPFISQEKLLPSVNHLLRFLNS